MAGEPEVENGYWGYRQGQDQPDRQMQTDIQNQINDQTDERTHAVVDREDGKQKIPWLALERITAPRAAIERHKPIAQGSNLIPRDEDRTDTTRWAFPPEGV